MEEYKGFKIGDKVRIRPKNELKEGDIIEYRIPEFFLDWVGGVTGNIKKIGADGTIWLNRDDGGTPPGVGPSHVFILLEYHNKFVPDELFEID